MDFLIDLRPSWYFGEKTDVPGWDVELSIEADCRHSVDHSHMHTVHEVEVRLHAPIAAAEALLNAAYELRRLATEIPAEHWLDLASDPKI